MGIEKVKVLVISYVALMDSTPNGRTMKSLLKGVSPQNISLFCCWGIPDEGACRSAFRVTNRDALRSLYKSKKVGEVITERKLTNDSDNYVRKGKKSAWKYYLKEKVWARRKWYNDKLKNWLREQNPDVIVYMYGDNISLQRFAIDVSKDLNIPLIVYSCEDYCMKDYNYIDFHNKSIFFKKYHKMSKIATKELFKVSDALIVNSDQLGRAYSDKYGIKNIHTIMMASEMQNVINYKIDKEKEIHLDYMGALGDYRLNALRDIGEALIKIDERIVLNIYGRATKEIIKKINSFRGVRYKGFVSYEEVKRIIRSSTLLVEAINNDSYFCKDKRYGLSTKYADCFACGTPFLVYAPLEIVETQFAKENRCAFVATNKTELESTLREAIFNEDARKEQLQQAKKVTEKYFNLGTNNEKVCKIISDVISQR